MIKLICDSLHVHRAAASAGVAKYAEAHWHLSSMERHWLMVIIGTVDPDESRVSLSSVVRFLRPILTLLAEEHRMITSWELFID